MIYFCVNEIHWIESVVFDLESNRLEIYIKTVVGVTTGQKP